MKLQPFWFLQLRLSRALLCDSFSSWPDFGRFGASTAPFDGFYPNNIMALRSRVDILAAIPENLR